jgi:hypothetical protein
MMSLAPLLLSLAVCSFVMTPRALLSQSYEWTPAGWLGSGCPPSLGPLWSLPGAGGPGYVLTNGVRLEGATWSEIGASTTGGAILSVTNADLGPGVHAFAAGGFTSLGGVAVTGIAEWNGQYWVDPGIAFQSTLSQSTVVSAIGRRSAGSTDAIVFAGLMYGGGIPPVGLRRRGSVGRCIVDSSGARIRNDL